MDNYSRVINLRFILDGLHFDAAIDPDWQLHAYGEKTREEKESVLPIEVYCFDRPEWDILMLYQTKEDANCSNVVNPQHDPRALYHPTLFSACSFEKILEETSKWKENMEK